jgi:transmembrane sensor
MLKGAGNQSGSLSQLDREALAWVELTIYGKPTADESAALERWRDQSPAHQKAYTLAVRLRKTVGVFPTGSTDHYRATLLNRPSSRRAILGGAASLAVVAYGLSRPPLGLWPSLAELGSDYRTGVGEQRKIALAGGVTVDMNTRTSLSLRNNADGPGVELIDGEVAIAAQLLPSHQFHVIAGSGRVVATAASLDVRNDDGAVRVTCLEGNAEILHANGRAQIGQHQQISYTDAGLIAPALVNSDTVAAWRQGVLIFHKARLGEVVAEINRYRPGRIVLMNRDLAELRFSGGVRIDRIGDIVSQIQRAANASATSVGGIVFLS